MPAIEVFQIRKSFGTAQALLSGQPFSAPRLFNALAGRNG
jgi:hypothetical protein